MTALKGQGAILAVGTATNGAAVNVTAATKASPCVLTTAANTFTAGEIGVVTGVLGMTQLNNRAFVMNPVTGTSATLKGEDSTNYTTYASGGSVQGYTMTQLASITDVKGFDGQASEIDVTNLASAAKEILLGLEDFGNVTVGCFLQNADAGQAYLRTAKSQQLIVPYSLTLSDGTIAAFMAAVRQFTFDGVKPDGAVSGVITLRVTNRPSWFA